MTAAAATILGAVIGAAASIIVCIVNNNKQAALIAYRLEQLEKKVEKHNNLVERMYALEEKSALHTEKIKAADSRIGALEKTKEGVTYVH